jgi:hypothetical protein
MHHVQKAWSIGTIREGILFRRILDEIKEKLG